MAEKRASRKTKSPRVFSHPPRQLKTPFRAGLYARVSTQDQQTIPLQTRAMRDYSARRGWTIALQVKEIGSGASQRERREQLLEAACRREIDVVLVWRLDRWGRSVTDLLATIQELEHLGVGFVSLTEALDLTTPAGRAMAGLLAVFAEFEREILRERVRAGLAHVRQNGQRLGRPLTAALHTDQVRKLYRAGSAKPQSLANWILAALLFVGFCPVRRDLKVDNETLLFLLKGGNLNRPDRIARGAWPHAPLSFEAVANYLASVLEQDEGWFPYQWEPHRTGQVVREGGTIERQENHRYV